jgi:hypothetical protein
MYFFYRIQFFFIRSFLRVGVLQKSLIDVVHCKFTEAHMAASSSSVTSLIAPYGGGAAAFVAALIYLDPISSSHNIVNEMACHEV